MTTERVDGPTPAGGEYSLATYVNLETLEEVDREEATGMMITEYAGDGRFLQETISEYMPPSR